ncbi:MAG: RNA-binding protein [Gemmatimonadetes bacterium]|nr:RNA-binding protein [Gemmatimonadota bacterium]
MPENQTSVRLDSWLWAARFYKTRTLAAEAVDGGKVDLNGDRPKRSRSVKVGDEISLRQGPFHYRVHVTGLADRRGPASVAATLYQEDPASLAARQALSEKLKLQAPIFFEGAGRPTKKQRREIDKWKGKA